MIGRLPVVPGIINFLLMTTRTAIRLSNICMILSGSLSVFGIFAFKSGYINNDFNSSPTSIAGTKQSDESKIAKPIKAQTTGKMNAQIFSQSEGMPLMQIFELKDYPLKTVTSTLEIDGSKEVKAIENRIHSPILMQP